MLLMFEAALRSSIERRRKIGSGSRGFQKRHAEEHAVIRSGAGLGAGLVLLFLALVMARSATAQIRNGSFEEIGSGGLPAGWHFTRAGEPVHEEGGEVEVKVVEGRAHSGRRAIELNSRISSFPCWFDQDLDAQGNGPLPMRGTISFWYKILEGTPGRPAVTVMSLGPQHRNYPG